MLRTISMFAKKPSPDAHLARSHQHCEHTGLAELGTTILVALLFEPRNSSFIISLAAYPGVALIGASHPLKKGCAVSPMLRGRRYPDFLQFARYKRKILRLANNACIAYDAGCLVKNNEDIFAGAFEVSRTRNHGTECSR